MALIVYAIFAGVIFATLKFGANAEVKFNTVFALIVYTRLPELLRALLATVSLFAGVSTDSFDIKNPLATMPGILSTERLLRPARVVGPFDIITIWTLVLVAIGITCIRKVKRGTAFAVVFGWFAVYVLSRSLWPPCFPEL